MILDPMDNILSKNTEHGNYNYGYDDLYRLTNVDNPTLSDEGYTYDSVGNRLTSTGVSGDWTYNENNELTGYGSTDFIYDANGNMTKKTFSGASTNYLYNTEDRLAEVRDGNNDLVAEYYYDPFGRRLWKDVGGNRTYLMCADEGLVAEINDAGSITRSYVWKPGGIWGTDCVAVKENGQYYFVHTDHLGTPQKLTDINGSVVWSATYSSFGSVTVDPFSMITFNLCFAGQFYDQESGLHYNFNRYYDPKGGRYIKRDPIGFGGGINLYVYVFDNPNKFIDQLGFAGYVGYEVSAVIFSIGLTSVNCVDENGKVWRFLYQKKCLGLAAGVTAGGGTVTGMNGKGCRGENYEGWFLELPLPGPLSADIGMASDPETGGPVSLGLGTGEYKGTGVNDIGFGVGPHAKIFNMCKYKMFYKQQIGCAW